MKKASALTAAVAEGRFKLVYQPVVALKTGELHHHEVLVRFGREESPFPMIRMAEELDLIEERLQLVVGKLGDRTTVVVGQHDAAAGAALHVDRYARRGEGLNVAVDRPRRNLERLSQLARGPAAFTLQQQKARDQPLIAHSIEYDTTCHIPRVQ